VDNLNGNFGSFGSADCEKIRKIRKPKEIRRTMGEVAELKAKSNQ
jgi:hypothetical protein